MDARPSIGGHDTETFLVPDAKEDLGQRTTASVARPLSPARLARRRGTGVRSGMGLSRT